MRAMPVTRLGWSFGLESCLGRKGRVTLVPSRLLELLLLPSGNRLLIIPGIVPGQPLGKACFIHRLGCRQLRDEQYMDIGCLHLRAVQDGQGPIKWVIAENLCRSEAVIVDNPSLSSSVQVADKDVSAQALMRHRVV